MTTVYKKAYANSNCSKSCVAVSFPASPAMSSTMVPIPYCQSIKDYTCLNIEMRKVFDEIACLQGFPVSLGFMFIRNCATSKKWQNNYSKDELFYRVLILRLAFWFTNLVFLLKCTYL